MISRVSAAEVARVGEAWGLLLVVRLLRAMVPMPRWAALLGQPTSPDTDSLACAVDAAIGVEGDVGLAVGRAGARTPFTATCLDRAAAAQVMLRRRGTPGSVVIGLAPDRTWGAHAWLVGRTGIVVGASEATSHAPATVFRDPRDPLESVGGRS